MWLEQYLQWCRDNYPGESWEDIMEQELEIASHNQRFMGASVYTDLDRVENEFKLFFWEHIEDVDYLERYVEGDIL